jgi:hypothetical protein
MGIREALQQFVTLADKAAQQGHPATDAGECLATARAALANGPVVVRVKVEHELEPCPDPFDLGEYSNTPGPEDRTIDRMFPPDDASPQYDHLGEFRYFIAAMSGEETGNPESVAQDYRRMEAYNLGEWRMMRIIATAEVQYLIGDGCHRIERLSSRGVWGVESDADVADIAAIEQDELNDLRRHLEVFGVDCADFDRLAAKAVSS